MFLIDADWYTKIVKGIFEINEKFDLSKVINEAKTKNVDIILYCDRHEGGYGDKELFPYLYSVGGKGIKYGFMSVNVPFAKKAMHMGLKVNCWSVFMMNRFYLQNLW
ncbi:hypothetical protein [Maribellus maritimus]|uniref:hypothetical protein n=1 Tax=Maribellus maritimus TaxID=2870838 RepID=UPI001EECA36B|nr:hypothetical protein [Maribellus maritimus]MCG6189719.1 hypothetical protein [Maribellus maritimus]